MLFTKKTLKRVCFHAFSIGFGFIMIYPILWLVASSFKGPTEVFRRAMSLIPETWVFQNYADGLRGFGGIPFTLFFRNSFYIVGLSTIGQVASSAIVAYGFARIRFRFKSILFACVIITMMLPMQIMAIPQYVMFNMINWIDSYLPLIVPTFFGNAFFIFLIYQFIQGITRDLDEAAYIDGCSKYSVFYRIVLPLIVPPLVTSAIFAFYWRWDDFFSALLYLQSPRKYPVSYALKMFADPSAVSNWGAMYAMSTLSLVPIAILFFSLQKYLVEGISTTGMKN